MKVIPMLSQHAQTLEELQRIVFPALANEERLRAEHYRAHLQIFPEGQFVLTIGEDPPATSSLAHAGSTGPATTSVGGARLLYRARQLLVRRQDPTLTRQRKIGFEPLGLIPNYLHDPACGNYGVLLRLDAGCEL